jgi:hypothetical protein
VAYRQRKADKSTYTPCLGEDRTVTTDPIADINKDILSIHAQLDVRMLKSMPAFPSQTTLREKISATAKSEIGKNINIATANRLSIWTPTPSRRQNCNKRSYYGYQCRKFHHHPKSNLCYLYQFRGLSNQDNVGRKYDKNANCRDWKGYQHGRDEILQKWGGDSHFLLPSVLVLALGVPCC